MISRHLLQGTRVPAGRKVAGPAKPCGPASHMPEKFTNGPTTQAPQGPTGGSWAPSWVLMPKKLIKKCRYSYLLKMAEVWKQRLKASPNDIAQGRSSDPGESGLNLILFKQRYWDIIYLLKHNLHTITSTQLKSTIQWSCVYLQSPAL